MTTPRKHTEHSLLERWAELISVLAAFAVVIGIAIPSPWLALGSVAILIMGVILQLTRPLNGESDLGAVFRLAYAFTLIVGIGAPLSLILIDKPFAFPAWPWSDPKKTDSSDFYRREHAALAIVPGCDYTAERFTKEIAKRIREAARSGTVVPGTRDEHSGMPYDVYCNSLPPQWVLSLGGNILKCHVDGTCPQQPPDAAKPPPNGTLKADLADAESQLAARRKELEKVEKSTHVGAAVDANNLRAAMRPLEDRAKSLRASAADAEARARAASEAAKASSEVIKNLAARPITGGLVVPVYFVVLTLLGALVNMIRRIPEYQHRSSDVYPEQFRKTELATGEEPRPPISYEQARDFVVFQIMQVASAPVIGVVAYAWAEPSQVASTTVLAFAAGFSSDLFLISIRNFAERIAGMPIPKTQAREISSDDAVKAAAQRLASVTGLGPGTLSNVIAASTRRPLRKGDRVRLTRQIEENLRVGDIGRVIEIGQDLSVVVRIEQAELVAAGTTLAPQPASVFELIEEALGAEGPVG